MTISATGPSSGRALPSRLRGGYTLLELCFVLFIIALVVGATAPGISSWLNEEKLRGTARQLELLARTARIDAVERQCAYDVVITPESLSLETDAPASKGFSLPDPYPVPSSTTVLTRSWQEDQFSNRPETRWRFQPSGLCEPLTVKLTENKSEISLRFDPLTAEVAEETYAFR